MAEDIIVPRRKLLGYLESLISPALKDEISASKEYREMADLAERLGMLDAAGKLRGIAGDEDRHHDILYDILVSIPQEIAKIYKK